MNENRTTAANNLHPSMTTGRIPCIGLSVHLARRSFDIDGGCQLVIVLPSGQRLVIDERHATFEKAMAARAELNYTLARILQGQGFKVFGPNLCVECGVRYVPGDDDQGLELCATCWQNLEREEQAWSERQF